MLNGKCALFLKTIVSVSPASPRSTGPTMPRCSHSGPRGLSLMKEASVYSRYTAFLKNPANVPGIILYKDTRPLVVRPTRHVVHLGRSVVPIHFIGSDVVGMSSTRSFERRLRCLSYL